MEKATKMTLIIMILCKRFMLMEMFKEEVTEMPH